MITIKSPIFRCWALVFVALLHSGCNHFLARQLISPPNAMHQRMHHVEPQLTLTEGKLRIPIGPPAAILAAWVVDPPKGTAPVGTLIVLHGFLVDHTWMHYAQEGFTRAGFRVVLVDLPGHGESTGQHITFGVNESRGLVQLLDALQANHLVAGKVGVYGVSLGAATALDFAARDPRVSSVVAVASYADMEQEIPHYGRLFMPIPGRLLSTDDFNQIMHRAEEIAGFTEADASPINAIPRIHVPILLLHGTHDAIVPVAAAQQLHAANPAHSELHLLEGEGHIAACYNWHDAVMKLAVPWLTSHLR